jgi:hypothetical protein
MSLLPLDCAAICGGMADCCLEDLLFLAGGLATVIFFVAMLGIHCGMISREFADGDWREPGNGVFPVLGDHHLHGDDDFV